VRNFRSSLRCRVVTVHVDDTSHLAATLLQEIPGNVPWYMPGSIAVLEDRYSEVVMNVMAALLADVGRPRHDHKQYWRSILL